MEQQMFEVLREDIRDLRKHIDERFGSHDDRLRVVENDSAVAKSWGKAAMSVAMVALAAIMARISGVA